MSGAIAAIAAKAQREIVSYFTARDAVSPARALSYKPDGRMLQRRMFARLCRVGVLKPAANGGHYLDVPAWEIYDRKRRRRLWAVIAGSVALAGAGIMSGMLA